MAHFEKLNFPEIDVTDTGRLLALRRCSSRRLLPRSAQGWISDEGNTHFSACVNPPLLTFMTVRSSVWQKFTALVSRAYGSKHCQGGEQGHYAITPTHKRAIDHYSLAIEESEKPTT